MLKLKLQYFGHLMRRKDSLADSASGKDCRQEEKGMTDDEILINALIYSETILD